MANTDHTVRVYEDLADWYDRNNQAKLRDWFLVLAADAALTGGKAAEAERLRGRLLHVNPHHLLKPFTSFAEALQSPDVQGYVADLRRTYSPQAAENLLASQRGAEGGRRPAEQPPPPQPASGPLLFEDPFPEVEPEPPVFKLEPVAEEPRPQPAPLPRQVPPPRASARQEPAPAPRSPPRARLPQPVPSARLPVLAPQPRPAAAPPRSAPADLDDADTATGGWVSSVLFVVVLATGVALAVYTFARPFLPPGWLR